MKIADHTNFVTAISEEKPVMIFFHRLSDATQTEKIKLILEDIEKDLPLLPVYEYIIDADKKNLELAEVLEISKTPVLLFFKNGTFHRFKNKMFNKPSIVSFIGFKKPYLLDPEDKKSSKEVLDENLEPKEKVVKTPKTKTVKATKTVAKKVAKKNTTKKKIK